MAATDSWRSLNMEALEFERALGKKTVQLEDVIKKYLPPEEGLQRASLWSPSWRP